MLKIYKNYSWAVDIIGFITQMLIIIMNYSDNSLFYFRSIPSPFYLIKLKYIHQQSFLCVVVVGTNNICRLGKRHIQNFIAEQKFVSRISQNLGNLFSVLNSSHVKISWIRIKLHGLFLEAWPTNSIDLAEA